MEDAFGAVLFAVVGVALVVALVVFARGGGAHDHIGRGGLSMDGEEARRQASAAPRGAAALAERDVEVRQMLEARNARRAARGEAPLDVEAELARLTAPAPAAIDAGLEAEIRQLVHARNARRERRGEAPLDVEAEVARQIRDLGAASGGGGPSSG